MKQKTIKNECTFSGVGLHTGCKVNLICKSADEDTGIRFVRVDLDDQPEIKVDPLNIHIDTTMPRCTAIGKNGAVIYTVEHFMSVLSGLGITNLIVEIDANELPGLDGSAIDFLNAIKNAGIEEQDAESLCFEIKEPLGVEMNGCSIFMVPDKELRISYTLDYDHPVLKSQFFSSVVNESTYEDLIAPCRTFCLESEAEELRARGLGKGANYQNTLVVGKDGVKENEVRFANEFTRHKVLDFIGDLYLLGMPIRGHVFAVKSGHTLNIELLKKILKQKEKYEKKTTISVPVIDGKKEIDINGIMNVLPHRYPFLLVDRVIEIEKGKKAVGIKNVTINENFFQGHFPARPVMPGVLMIEAMAQVAGVVILTNELHRGKVAFFMAVDNVKFRKVVSPGDQLIMEVEVVRDKSRTAYVRGKSKVDGKIVAEADMTFSFADAAYLE
ncbi:MAG: UDP-3-O-[3-hydroxymyristoyl] N-acetylglucosamine deacetylase [Candidatus Omnitrophica bacterium]|nr:UDP-3-O-[3-hydroxymyristoyl] N-acetylglucosamine deacetylase [Candidatus Omnitrophota bacterium]